MDHATAAPAPQPDALAQRPAGFDAWDRPGWRRAALALFVIEVALAVGFAVLSAGSYRPWAPVDEAAHFGYIESLAVRHRLPVLTRDRLSWQVEAIGEGRYPRRPRSRPGPSYEAFQPPLYYLLATPAFLAADGYRAKVRAIRYFDVALLVSAAALLYLLARELFPRRWQPALPLAGVVLLWPGVVIRSVTISNDALAIPVALLFLLLAARAFAAPGLRRTALAAAGFGLCLLAKLTLAYLGVVLLPLLLLGRRSLRSRAAGALAAVAIVGCMLSPWVTFNLAHFGAPTGDGVARQLQARWDGPDKRVSSLGAIASRLPGLALWTLPQEWVEPAATTPVPHPSRLTTVRVNKVVGGAIEGVVLAIAVAAAILYRRELTWRRLLLLAVPVVAAIALLAIASRVADWDVLVSRYLYAAVLPLALLAGAGWARMARSPRIVLGLPLALVVGTIGMWASLVGTFLPPHR